MRALDLFCGAGGASKGLQDAGFEVVGIDINEKRAKRYPCMFVHGDATRPPVDPNGFDFVWASPPCQAFSNASYHKPERVSEYPNFISETREMLDEWGIPYVIENVPLAPIRADIVLNGALFGLPIVRRRHFECGGWNPPLILTSNYLTKTVTNADLAQVAGHSGHPGKAARRAWNRRNSAKGWQAAMGIDWMTRRELVESVPPAYSRRIAEAFLEWRDTNA